MKRGNILVPIGLTILLSIPLVLFFWTADLTPVLASQQGSEVDFLLRLIFAIAAFIFSLIVVFLVYSLIVFRRPPGDTTDGRPLFGNTRLEIAWTVIPLLVIFSVGILGVRAMYALSRPRPNELTVKVIGFQFAWLFKYPEYGITSSELVLPIDRPIKFEVTSRDVIHSFWIPEFRMKMDAIPGQVNVIRYVPDRLGNYKVRCAELCGAGHYAMLAPAHILPAYKFQEWVTKQTGAAAGLAQGTPAAGGEAAAGKALVGQLGCLSCHSVDGRRSVGPTWKGLYGSQVKLKDGSTVTADENYLHTSIVDPSRQIVAGYQDIMPKTYKSQLSEKQIRQIIAYIKTLK